MIRNYFLCAAILISAPLVHGMQANDDSLHQVTVPSDTWFTCPDSEEELEEMFQAIRKAIEGEGSDKEKLQRASDALKKHAAQSIQESHKAK